MNAKPELTQIIKEVARRLRVAPKRLEDGQDTINEILDYFETGHLPVSQETSGEEQSRLPQFVQTKLLRVGQALLSVRTVTRSTHPLLSTVHEAFITFAVENDDGNEVPAWKELTPDTSPETDGNVAFTFTSAIPLRSNLVDFVTFVTSPRPKASRSEGTSIVRDWLANVGTSHDTVVVAQTKAREAKRRSRDVA
jgi:hypothetical protein